MLEIISGQVVSKKLRQVEEPSFSARLAAKVVALVFQGSEYPPLSIFKIYVAFLCVCLKMCKLFSLLSAFYKMFSILQTL